MSSTSAVDHGPPSLLPHLIFTNTSNGATVDVDCAFDCSATFGAATAQAVLCAAADPAPTEPSTPVATAN